MSLIQITRVAIIGGGLGGLALAQHLKAANFYCTLYERDESLHSRNQGYYIGLQKEGLDTLKDILHNLPSLDGMLKPEGKNAGTNLSQFVIVDDQMRHLMSLSGNDSILVNRWEFRSSLAHDLPNIQWNKKLVQYYEIPRNYFSSSCSAFTSPSPVPAELHEVIQQFDPNEAGGVLLQFEDGQFDWADFVVGADGANSRLRRIRAPKLQNEDTGYFAIGGLLPMPPSVAHHFPILDQQEGQEAKEDEKDPSQQQQDSSSVSPSSSSSSSSSSASASDEFVFSTLPPFLKGSLLRVLGRDGHTLLMFPCMKEKDVLEGRKKEWQVLWALSFPRSSLEEVIIGEEAGGNDEDGKQQKDTGKAKDEEEAEEAVVLDEDEAKEKRSLAGGFGAPSKFTPEELKTMVLKKMDLHFSHPELVRIVEETPSESVMHFGSVFSAKPRSDNPFLRLNPETGKPITKPGDFPRDYLPRVTLLGDSAHPMTTHRGMGANTALMDAQDLAKAIKHIHNELNRQLLEAPLEHSELLLEWRKAVLDYEELLFRRGFNWVKQSLQSTNMIHAGGFGGSMRNWFLWAIGKGKDLFYSSPKK